MMRIVFRRSFSAAAAAAPAEKLERTALYNLHTQLQGKMVPFAGYELPVQYPDGVLKSHLHTRAPNCASLFDVGHMGQIRWHGKDRASFLEKLVVADVADMREGEAKLTLITNAKGGIMDDSVITNHGSYIYMVVNGATKAKDMAHFDASLATMGSGMDVRYEYLHTQNLVALQGPGAPDVLSRLVGAADATAVRNMPFMSGKPMDVMGVRGCIITRCGYTGEDGYEISMPPDAAERITRALLDHKQVLPAGLGARDSLRLEAGLCLYGQDITEETTPGEAMLAWTIGKRRRGAGGFLGAERVLSQIAAKAMPQKRVGVAVEAVPARTGVKLFDAADKKPVGVITSGTFSPCLKVPVAMGYVSAPHAKAGTALLAEVRGKMIPARVAPLPFVPHKYFKSAA